MPIVKKEAELKAMQADACEQLRNHPIDFLNTHALTINTVGQPRLSGETNYFLNFRAHGGNVHEGVELKTVRGTDGSDVPLTMLNGIRDHIARSDVSVTDHRSFLDKHLLRQPDPPKMASTNIEDVRIGVWHVPGQKSFDAALSTTHLPREGGPDIMITTQFTGCTFTLIPVGGGAYEAAHVEPMDGPKKMGDYNTVNRTTFDEGHLRTGEELKDAVAKHAIDGQIVFGKQDLLGGSGTVVGVRTNGEWSFYKQIQRDGEILGVEKLEPLRNARVLPEGMQAADLLRTAVAEPAKYEQEVQGRSSALQQGQDVAGCVLGHKDGSTYIRDDSQTAKPLHERAVKTIPTPAQRPALGASVNVQMDNEHHVSLQVMPAELATYKKRSQLRDGQEVTGKVLANLDGKTYVRNDQAQGPLDSRPVKVFATPAGEPPAVGANLTVRRDGEALNIQVPVWNRVHQMPGVERNTQAAGHRPMR